MSDDLISRAEAIDAVCEMVKECFGADEEEQTAIAVTIRNLPSAQPYTDEEIQKMQDLEQAQLDKAYQIGVEEGLPSAQPERKTGRWINEGVYGEGHAQCSIRCDNPLCNFHYIGYLDDYNFCPNCGAEMEVSE